MILPRMGYSLIYIYSNRESPWNPRELPKIIFTHINLVDTKTKLSLMSSLDFPNTHITRVDTLVSMTTKIIE